MREDVTDGGMIDISEADLGKLLTADESSLMAALNRILETARDDAYNSFTATI
jgi:FXSXX-COOH protein